MNKIAAGLLFAVAANAAERYIIHFDNAAWESLNVNALPEHTVNVFGDLKMTVADMTAEEVAMYESMPGVTVHKDEAIELFGKVQENPSNWGIDRIDQHDLPLDKKYHYGTEGEGVNAYIIDTGILTTHVEFGGRVATQTDVSGDSGDRLNKDCIGHGTHVASSVAGETVGVAKKATLHAVKVFTCAGQGSLSTVLAGIQHVTKDHKSKAGQKSVINMSLGGPRSSVVNSATVEATKAGITVVVAAGNANTDACRYSPASTPEAITVAASMIDDTRSSFSNYGTCVDIYAPGEAINGAWIGGDKEYKSIRGTSMASPHVAGAAALVLSSGKATTPAEVEKLLVSVATADKIKGNPRATPNKLLFADPTWAAAKTSRDHGNFPPRRRYPRFSSFRALNNL